MFNLNQKGVIHLLVPILLLLGIIGGVFLVTNGNPLKLFSRATNPPIVFKSSQGAALPTNSSGVPQSTSATIKIELTSTLGPPIYPISSPISPPPPPQSVFESSDEGGDDSGGDTEGVSAVNAQTAVGTVSYKIAENPTDLTSASDQSYTKEPTVIDYTFKDSSLGSKFIWVEFKDNTGKVDRRSAQIEIISPTPYPTPTSGKTPPCEIYGDLNLDGKVDSTDVDLASKVASGQIIPSSSVAGGDTQHMSKVGDVNNDNKVDSQDVSLIDGYVKGQSSTFPVCQSAKASPCGSLGDVTTDGKVSSIDAYEALRIVTGSKDSLYTKQPFTDDQKTRADVDGDKNVSSIDSLHIQRYLLGRITTFKGCPAQPSPSPSPTPTATSGYHRVFITSTDYNGNLQGSSGADAKCQTRANVANLGGTWKAWVSDSSSSASDRLNHSDLPYKLLDGSTVIANNWNDLIDGTIKSSINKDEFNSKITSNTVWTGTSITGSALPINCSNWTSTTSDISVTTGGYGLVSETNKNWTDFANTRCDNVTKLYCIEQTISTAPPIPNPKRVFVTDAVFNSNLGGLSGADQKCLNRALAAGLGGFWKAWLSDSTISAASRMNQSTLPYKLINGVTVVNNWSDLVDGTIQNPINVTEKRGTLSFGSVWTGTDRYGGISPPKGLPEYKCFDWTRAEGATSVGNVQSKDHGWTEGGGNCIPTTNRLYCFEQ